MKKLGRLGFSLFSVFLASKGMGAESALTEKIVDCMEIQNKEVIASSGIFKGNGRHFIRSSLLSTIGDECPEIQKLTLTSSARKETWASKRLAKIDELDSDENDFIYYEEGGCCGERFALNRLDINAILQHFPNLVSLNLQDHVLSYVFIEILFTHLQNHHTLAELNLSNAGFGRKMLSRTSGFFSDIADDLCRPSSRSTNEDNEEKQPEQKKNIDDQLRQKIEEALGAGDLMSLMDIAFEQANLMPITRVDGTEEEELRDIHYLSTALTQNTSLKTLDLSGNWISKKDLPLLIEGLSNNKTLTTLDLSFNLFDEDDLQQLKLFQAGHPSLENLVLEPQNDLRLLQAKAHGFVV